MFRRLLRQAPFFGYVFTVISPQTVGAYRIRPPWRREGAFSDVGWFVAFRACSLI